MRILFAVQGTGNGHISRAREILPYLEEYGDVDTLVSSQASEVTLDRPWTYQKHGLGFFFGKRGGIDYGKTIRKFKPFKLMRDIFKLPIRDYDLVISDFEPISAWAARLHGVRCVEMSNQMAFLSPKTPRPRHESLFPELVLRHYAPAAEYIGFHFERYDHFIHTPIIRREVRALKPCVGKKVLVYLPAHDDRLLCRVLQRIRGIEWEVYSKHVKASYSRANVHVRPIQHEAFLQSLESCLGVVSAAGFETCAEALFLGKKLFVIPMKRQYEQLCNAEALSRMGVCTAESVHGDFPERLESWLSSEEPLTVEFPDETGTIIQDIMLR